MRTITSKRIGLALGGVILLGVVVVLLVRPVAPRATDSGPGQQHPGVGSTLSVDPVPAQQGGKVRLVGQGFRAGELVVIRVETTQSGVRPANNASGPAASNDEELVRTRAGAQGALAATSVTLPGDLYSGVHRVEAVGQSSGQSATATLYVRAKAPWINVSSYAVKPRDQLGFIVGGFQPGERVQLSLAPATRLPSGQSQDLTKLSQPTALVTVPTDQVGNAAWAEVQLPLLKPGTYEVTALGASSRIKATADLSAVPLSPVVQLSPWAGPPGTAVELNARGFASGEKVQVFLGPANALTLTTAADKYGNFWGVGPIRVPYSVGAGTLPFRLVGQDSGATVIAVFNVLAVKPWLELSQWSGPPGSPVSFSGGGWAADERVAIHLDSASGPTVAEGQVNDEGWLQPGSGGTVPGDATTSTTFVAVGEQTHATASASFKVVNPFQGVPPSLP